MAINEINVGNIANDGTGDDLREAFIKVNDNLNDLDSRITNIPLSVENIGTSGEGIYAQTVNNVLQFKKLQAGQNVSLTANNDTITINSTGGISGILVLSDNGSITVNNNNYLGIMGGNSINTRVSNTHLFVDLDPTNLVEQDTNPKLGGTLNVDYNNISNVGTINAASFLGNLTGLVHGIDIRYLDAYFDNNWDFGKLIERRFTSILDLIIRDYTVDMGAFIGQDVSDIEIDLGTIST